MFYGCQSFVFDWLLILLRNPIILCCQNKDVSERLSQSVSKRVSFSATPS